jgi:hypothetical protein
LKLFSSKASKGLILSLLSAVPLVAAFSHGDDLRHVFNNAANAGTPLDQRDLITHKDPNGYSSVIAGSYISRTGSVPDHAYISPANLLQIRNIDIDLKADDAFTRSLATMQQTVSDRISENAGLQALYRKQDWTAQDRTIWDKTVANIIADVVSHTPGLSQYRTMGGKVKELRHLNDLSKDITNGTINDEFDCEAMSVVKIILQQRMADSFLSHAQKANYFYVSGEGELSLYDDKPGGHAFIIVEKDGQVEGVIEATEDYNVFLPLAASVSFSDFAAGKEIVTRNGGVYGFEFTHDQAEQDRLNAGIKPYSVMQQEMRERRQRQPGILWLQPGGV